MKTSEIEHEERHWSEIFRKEKNKPNFRTFSSYWWKTYYGEIVSCSSGFLPKDGKGRVLELGSGSGKSSILISDRAEKVTLLDISPSALEYARFLAEKFGARNVETVQGDAFDAPFDSSAFDFVWNIGVLEHYSMPQIRQYLSEMARLVKSWGTLAFGIPNARSLPILKAWVLSLKPFRWIPWYRLDSEKFHPVEAYLSVLEEMSSRWIRFEGVTVRRFGSFLPMETPEFLLRLFAPIEKKWFQKGKFLLFISCKVVK